MTVTEYMELMNTATGREFYVSAEGLGISIEQFQTLVRAWKQGRGCDGFSFVKVLTTERMTGGPGVVVLRRDA